ncbi:MAG TPA: ribosomal-protein-alanine N-acetyltransferase [Candidatus Marinimicrobia bacterium]|nr:ribosomal-protein-alanine N-acetyltransferase [Candidatus Neomarinimicrobiota bacterium]
MDTPENIRLRPADERDIREVIAVEKMSFTSPWSIDSFRHELYNPVSYFYIIEIQRKLTGYIIFWIFEDESHIANIAIHSDFRKKGYGEYLLQWTIEFVRGKGAKTITLEVNEKNTAARNLYEKLGFKCVGRRAKYYENRDDALMLTKYIS